MLHTFSHIDHDNYAIHRSEGAIGVLGEVLVTRGVENIDFVVAIVETHHRSRHRDTALFLDFHPVGGCGFLDFVRLHGTGHVDSATKEKQFLGERSLTGIRV